MIMNIMIGILVIAAFVTLIVIVNDYARNTMGDLKYQYLCAKERRLKMQKAGDEELLKRSIEEEKIAKAQKEDFYQKWHLLMGRKPISMFDVRCQIVLDNIRQKEQK